jgi:hypothetical protein
MVTRIQLPLTGSFYWKLVFEYDNPTNAGTIVTTYRPKLVDNFRPLTFLEHVKKALRKENTTKRVNVDVGSAYSFASASFDHGFENNVIKGLLRSQTYVSRETETQVETKC